MPNVIVKARVSSELKQEAEAVFTAIGMSTSQAISLFMQQVVNSGGLPFQPTAKTPNAKTRQAMTELEEGGGETFQTTSEMLANWKR